MIHLSIFHSYKINAPFSIKAEFINAINNAYTAEFIDCFANNSELKIELGVNYYDAEKQYRKYRKFSLCSVALYAEKVIWNWY